MGPVAGHEAGDGQAGLVERDGQGDGGGGHGLPPWVFTLNAKNHPGAKIWIGGDTFMVNGQRQPYVRNSRFEARRAAKLRSAATGAPVVAVGVIVPVGAADIRVKELPADVKVVNRTRLVGWLESMPPALPPERIDALFNAARRATTWQPR